MKLIIIFSVVLQSKFTIKIQWFNHGCIIDED